MCEWLKNIACQNVVSNIVSSSFINLLFEMHIKYKVSLTLFEHISASVGGVTGVLTQVGKIKLFIGTAFCLVCSHYCKKFIYFRKNITKKILQ